MAGTRVEDDEISAINVTPLVDVVLVLLVIFMITAPTLYQNALKVNLPKAQSGEDQGKTALQIGMTESGAIQVDGKPLSLDELRARVKTQPVQSAVVLADKRVTHGKVIELIDLLKSNGVQKFSFGVER